MATIINTDDRPAFHARAACAGRATIMFPEQSKGRTAYDEARKLCAICPVIDQCAAEGDALEQHLAVAQVVGFRANETPTDRYRRRTRQPVAA